MLTLVYDKDERISLANALNNFCGGIRLRHAATNITIYLLSPHTSPPSTPPNRIALARSYHHHRITARPLLLHCPHHICEGVSSIVEPGLRVPPDVEADLTQPGAHLFAQPCTGC